MKPSEKYLLDGWIGFPAYFIHLLSQDTDLYSWHEASLPPAHWQHHHIAWFGWSARFFNWIILFPLIFLMGVHKNVCWRIFRARNLNFLFNKQLFCPQVGIFGYYPLLSGIFVELNLDRIQPALLSHSAGYWWPPHHTWWWSSPIATSLMDLRPRIFVMLPCLQFSLLRPNTATTQWVIPARPTLRSAPLYFLFAPLLGYPELVMFLALNENVSLELPQVLHRLQNKEKPMQNNFYSPVRVTQDDFRVQHCKVWCGTG